MVNNSLDGRAVALIDTAALSHNFQAVHGYVRKAAGRALRAIAVVKADAYGHTLSLTVPALLRAGCRAFAVATLGEALTVRQLSPAADILILGCTPPQHAHLLAEQRITQAVFSADYAKALSSAATAADCTVRVHLKVDIGMCRLGLCPEETATLLSVAALPALKAEGLFAHLPSADCDPQGTKQAVARFSACRAALCAKGFSPFCHVAASAAALSCPASLFDGYRAGLSLYGIAPLTTALQLFPAMSLVCPVVQLHRVPAGTHVGYGGDFITTRDSLLGTLPIGYADGLCRRFSGAAVTLLHGNSTYRVPLVGRICMDLATVDLTGTPAAVGDLVRIFDSAATHAAYLNTIPYEILTAIGPRVPRVEKGRL